MPISTSIYNYPTAFMDLATELQAHANKSIEVPCKDKSQAARYRFKLYGFQKAIRVAGLEHELSVMANAEICLRDNIVLIQNRDVTWANDLTANALKNIKEPE